MSYFHVQLPACACPSSCWVTQLPPQNQTGSPNPKSFLTMMKAMWAQTLLQRIISSSGAIVPLHQSTFWPEITAGVDSICLLTHQSSNRAHKHPPKGNEVKLGSHFLGTLSICYSKWKVRNRSCLILNISERKSAQSKDQIRFQRVIIKPGLRDTVEGYWHFGTVWHNT